jgi:hypothetical protein
MYAVISNQKKGVETLSEAIERSCVQAYPQGLLSSSLYYYCKSDFWARLNSIFWAHLPNFSVLRIIITLIVPITGKGQ